MSDTYRQYFNIDPEYFPQVNERVIEENPDLWKKFYPHETFVTLIKNTISVLSRKQRVSLWVEGAYGTGKSHAVLTLKKLLEASPEDTEAYFSAYPEQLGNDLCQRFLHEKSGKKLLTVHRYGSSTIHGDSDLVFAIQERIKEAMVENGLEASGNSTLRQSVLRWLEDEINHDLFHKLIQGPYRDDFGGDTADAVVDKLKTYEGDSLLLLMNKITKVASDRQLGVMDMTTEDLIQWIKAVIDENDLKGILFIWDEFTEYFRNNKTHLTGFQEIVDASSSMPFYMLIVTHDAQHIFPDKDKEFGKIKGRFYDPICEISLPDTMAFRLMGAAMEITKDPVLAEEWQDTIYDLYDRTESSRKAVMQHAAISDRELKKILPIHPYTALLLKHISTAFDSNQRSMFDFIKNDRGKEIKGFQYFIDNCGPLDDNPLLTVVELWDFFYEKGKEYLAPEIRRTLDYYNMISGKNLQPDQRRVLQATLLMQALSQGMGNSVKLFLPTEENIANVFEGSDLEGDAEHILRELAKANVLYTMGMTLRDGGRKVDINVYAAKIGRVDVDDEKKREEREKALAKSTSELVAQGEVGSVVALADALKLRIEVRTAGAKDLKSRANELRNMELGNRFGLVAAFAKNDQESITIGKTIQELVRDPSYHLLFVDTSMSPLGMDLLGQYADAMADSACARGNDTKYAGQREQDAKEVLKRWRQKIEGGEFMLYTPGNPAGERATTLEALMTGIQKYDRKCYPNGLESIGPVNATMWTANSLGAGIECGATGKTKGTYNSGNQNTKLEKYIGSEVWNAPADQNYWEINPYHPISKIKIKVKEVIDAAFDAKGEISIRDLYDVLTEAPFGFMPCNLTAFVMGFLLREYADGAYTYTDGVTNDSMSLNHLKTMVVDVIKKQLTPTAKYKETYIRTMTPEERKFHDVASEVFDLRRDLCTTVEKTRDRIRNEMKRYSFPIWCVKYCMDSETLSSDPQTITRLIDDFSGIANSGNLSGKHTDSEIASEIGDICLRNLEAVDDLKKLVNGDKCRQGMDAYIHQFEDGMLIRLAEEIGDNGQYINRLRKKFDADAANWVWNVETAEQKIREVILEYQIIVESNKIIQREVSFEQTIQAWCDVCGRIHISYQYGKNYWDELGSFMEMLYRIKRSGALHETQREQFLQLLTLQGKNFKAFYENQLQVFQRACEFYLENEKFVENEVAELYKRIKGSSIFTMEKGEYSKIVTEAINDFKLSQKSIQMRKLWSEKTGTDSPMEWSERYSMPILSMVPENEVARARECFDTLNQKHPSVQAIDVALDYLKTIQWFDSLEDEKKRDEAFRRDIISDRYDVLLTDIDDVKKYLRSQIPKVYHWHGNNTVGKKLQQMAQAKYNEFGSEKAEEKIDKMDVSDVKRYLKQLIRDNMTVGVEIIKQMEE